MKQLRPILGTFLSLLAIGAIAEENHSQRYRIYSMQNGVVVAQGNMGQSDGMRPPPSGNQGQNPGQGMRMPPPRPGQGGMMQQGNQGEQNGMRMPPPPGQGGMMPSQGKPGQQNGKMSPPPQGKDDTFSSQLDQPK